MNRTPAPWLVVFRREIVAKLTDRAFLVGFAFTIVLISAVMGINIYLATKTSTYSIVTTEAGRPIAEQIVKTLPTVDKDSTASVRVVATEDAARSAVDDTSADIWLHPTTASGAGSSSGWTVTGRDEVDSDIIQAATLATAQHALATNAQALGASVNDLTKGSTLSVGYLHGDAEKKGFAMAVTFALAMLFYIASLGFGLTLAGSVVEEKQSRLVEIIASKIPIRALLAGKVLGNLVLAVGQTAVFVAVAVVGAAFTQYGSLLSGVSSAIIWFIVYFLFGFLLLACLWAVAGSLASRIEDLQSTSMPLSLLTLGMFFGAMFIEGPWLTVLSYVPPLSAILMPKRLVLGEALWWEPLLGLGLLAAAAAGVVLVAERLYRRALLQTGGRVSMRQAWTQNV